MCYCHQEERTLYPVAGTDHTTIDITELRPFIEAFFLLLDNLFFCMEQLTNARRVEVVVTWNVVKTETTATRKKQLLHNICS